MALAYLLNWYPQPSQTALRREITALEEMGISFHRLSLRRYEGSLVDPSDIRERDRTRSVLDAGILGFLSAVLRSLVTRPRTFVRALGLAIKIGRLDERGLIRNLIYFAEACVLRQWSSDLDIDHIHTHYGTNSATAAMLCRVLNGPTYSFTMHGPEEFDAPRSNCLNDKIHHALFVVAISEFTRSQLYRWANYSDWSKIHVIRVGVSPMFLEHRPSPITSVPRLVNIGRIVEQKGQAILIQAAAGLRDRGITFQLSIVGDGPMRAEIERLIEQLDLQECVTITGYLSNQGVLDQLLASRALVLPSFAEGLPGVFFEALAVGRPVISTYIAAHPELIEAGVNGWLVPAGAVEPLVDAMSEALIADATVLEKMGRAGAKKVAEQHNVHTEASRLLELFERRSLGDSISSVEAAPKLSHEESSSG